MAGMKAILERVGAVRDVSLEGEGGMTASARPAGWGPWKAGAARVGWIAATLTYAPDAPVRDKYLDIEPELIWIFDGLEAYNDVFSNLYWNIT